MDFDLDSGAQRTVWHLRGVQILSKHLMVKQYLDDVLTSYYAKVSHYAYTIP